MNNEITRDIIRALSAAQFEQVRQWIMEDDIARTEQHKRETLARIRELARSIKIGIKIEGSPGRPTHRKNKDSL
jgi:hypothetical protein